MTSKSETATIRVTSETLRKLKLIALLDGRLMGDIADEILGDILGQEIEQRRAEIGGIFDTTAHR